MTSVNGKRKAKPGDIRRYHDYRDAGLSVEDAARALGFKKSWGYQQDQKRKQEERAQEEQETEAFPADDLSDAVELIIAERTGDDERAFEIVDEFSALIVPYLSRVAWLLATERATNLNRNLRGLLQGTPMLDEYTAAPISAREILEAIPERSRQVQSGDFSPAAWMPRRAQEWKGRLLRMFPSLREIEDAVVVAISSDDPEDALMAFRRSLYEELESA